MKPNLTEYYPLKFKQLTLTQIDANITDEDKKNVLSLLNDVDTTDSVKDLIEKDTSKRYPGILGYSLDYGYSGQYFSYTQKAYNEYDV